VACTLVMSFIFGNYSFTFPVGSISSCIYIVCSTISCQNEIFLSLSSELLNVEREKMEQSVIKMFDVNGKCIEDGKCWNPYS